MDCAPKQPSSPIADTPCVSGRGGDDDDDAPLLNASFSVPFWLLLDIWKRPVCAFVLLSSSQQCRAAPRAGWKEGGGGPSAPPKHSGQEWTPPTSIHALGGFFRGEGGGGVGCCSPNLPLQPHFAPQAAARPSGRGWGLCPPPPSSAVRGRRGEVWGWGGGFGGFASLHVLLKGTQRSGIIGERPQISSNACLDLGGSGGG